MTGNTGFFNRRLAKNLLPLPGFNPPSVGDLAPDFSLPRINGEPIQLSQYQGVKPVLLAFTRIFTEKLFCPFCYPHIQDLKTQYHKIKETGIELLMISSTDALQSQQIVNDLNLPYPFLYDPDCTVFRLYDVGQALGAPLPAQYIINLDGKVTYRHLFSFTDSNADSAKLLTELKSLAS
ncbi:MAG: peroxiredoxin family protein [Microcystaceae cyanobacterium]